MPKGLALKRSGAHRQVCLSLYRALLTTCKAFNLKATSNSGTLSSQLQNLVKFRFKHDRNLQAPKRIQDSVQYGRDSLQLLHTASNGSKTALKEMAELLKSARDLATSRSIAKQHCDQDRHSLKEHVQRKQAYVDMVRDPNTYMSPKPNSVPITSRPVPLSRIKSRKRRYPRYVVAQGIPFLRYQRRQSYLLSLYLRGRLRRTERWWSTILKMDEMIPLAEHEDAWDTELYVAHGVKDDDGGYMDPDGCAVKWVSEFNWTKRDTRLKVTGDDHNRMAWGRKLYNIMLMERELAMKEQRDAKAIARRVKQPGKATQI